MNKEESLQFMKERLREQESAVPDDYGLQSTPPVLRRFAIELEQDESHVFEHVDPSFTVRCMRGGVWVSHEDGREDAVLVTGESYRAEGEDRVHLYALTPVELEVEFEDQVTQH